MAGDAAVEQGRGLRRHPIAGLAELQLHQLAPDLFKSGPHFGQGNLRPPGEIAEGGRAVAPKVAQHELGDPVLPLKVPRVRDPLVERHQQLLVPGQRPLDQPRMPAQRPQDMDPPLAGGGLTGGLKHGEKFAPADEPPPATRSKATSRHFSMSAQVMSSSRCRPRPRGEAVPP